MKKAVNFAIALMLLVSLTACGIEKENFFSEIIGFNGKIIEVNEGSFLVEPLDGEEEKNSSDRFTVPIQHIAGNREPIEGDILYIQYDGQIKERYPAQLGEIYKISFVDTVIEMEAPKEDKMNDLIPMVMVDGILYLDTGKESTAQERCGTMDGEITSTVDQTEKPTKDDQSNFGTGYGYQYASEGTIEIYMNEKWLVFAVESEK